MLSDDGTRRGREGRPIPAVSVLALILAVIPIAGCGSTSEETPAAPAATPATETAAAAPDPAARSWTVPAVEWIESGDVATAGEDRHAVLVGADTYEDPRWDAPFAGRNLNTMRTALQKHCAIPGPAIDVLQGTAVHHAAVESTVLEAGRRLGSKRALLVLYFTGLGYVDREGMPYVFTHFTHRRPDRSHDVVIRRAEIEAWVSQARREAEERGTQLDVVAIFDAARPASVPAPPAASLPPASSWELWSAREGAFDPAPEERRPLPFTRSLVISVADAAGNDGSDAEDAADKVTRVFKDAALRTVPDGARDATLPQLVKPAGGGVEPRLVKTNQVVFGVAVVDALTGAPVADARIEWDARNASRATEPTTVKSTPGVHLLRARAPGYLARTELVDLRGSLSGMLAKVALLPEVVIVRGRVTPAGRYEVSADGLEADLHDGYHLVRATTDGRGRFELYLPGLAQGAELVVPDGMSEQRVPLPSHPHRFVREDGDGLDGVGVVDLGPVGASSAAIVALLSQAGLQLDPDEHGLLFPLPAAFDHPEDQLTPTFDSDDAESLWNQAMRLVERGRLDRARDVLIEMPSDTASRSVERWLGWIEIQTALEHGDPALLALQLEALPRQSQGARSALEAIALSYRLRKAAALAAKGRADAMDALLPTWGESLLASAEDYERDVVEHANELSLAVAAQLLKSLRSERKWMQLLEVCESAGAQPPWADELWVALRAHVVAEALDTLLAQGLAEGMRDDHWKSAEFALAWIERHRDEGWSDRPALEERIARVDDERIRADVREAYRAAVKAFTQGRLERALGHYRQARLGANERYAALIDEQLAYLRDQLYLRHRHHGLEADLQGRTDEAVAAFLTALRYDDRALDDLSYLEAPSRFVVSAAGNGDFASLSEAVAAAPPLSLVVVRPGDYVENVVIDRPLVLEAEGDLPTWVRAESGPALVVDSEHVVLRGIHLGAGDDGPAIEHRSGRLELSRCEIDGGSQVGIQSRGVDTRLVLEGCQVRAASGTGVELAEGADAVLRRCELVRIARGVSIRGAAAKLSDCRVAGGDVGLVVTDDGRAALEQSRFRDLSEAAIRLDDRARAIAHRTTIHVPGGAVGLHAAGDSGGLFTDCTVEGVVTDTGHDTDGDVAAGDGDWRERAALVELEDRAAPTFRSCRVQNGAAHGARIRGAAPRFEDTTFARNGLVNVIVEDGADPTFTRCDLVDAGKHGLLADDGAQGRWHAGEISGNGRGTSHAAESAAARGSLVWPQIVLSGGADPLFRGVAVRRGSDAGVAAHGRLTRGRFEDCAIEANARHGVRTTDGAAPVLTECRLSRNGGSGLHADAGGRGTLVGCDVERQELAGIWVGTDGDPTVQRCTVRDNGKSGVLVAQGGAGFFESTTIEANAEFGVVVRDLGEPAFRDCRILDNAWSGLAVQSSGGGTFDGCFLSGNGRDGSPGEGYAEVSIADQGDPLLRDCRIHHGDNTGVAVVAGGLGRFEQCSIGDNGKYGVHVVADAEPTFLDCWVTRNGWAGIFVESGGRGTVEDCHVAGNGAGQLVIREGALLVEEGNTVVMQ